MLPAPHRLRRRRDFGVATRRGRRAGSATVVAHLAVAAGSCGPVAGATDQTAGPAAAPPRIGFVVGGAVGPAVVRNRVRRRLRHLMAARLRSLPDGTLLVLRALPAAAGATSAQLAADVAVVLERLGAGAEPVVDAAGVPA